MLRKFTEDQADDVCRNSNYYGDYEIEIGGEKHTITMGFDVDIVYHDEPELIIRNIYHMSDFDNQEVFLGLSRYVDAHFDDFHADCILEFGV